MLDLAGSSSGVTGRDYDIGSTIIYIIGIAALIFLFIALIGLLFGPPMYGPGGPPYFYKKSSFVSPHSDYQQPFTFGWSPFSAMDRHSVSQSVNTGVALWIWGF